LINKLKTLYELQLLDDQLDQLENLRGDLPSTVNELQEKIFDFERIINAKKEEQEESIKRRTNNENEIERLVENQKKFKAQLYSVRNNKEYDALTKEIDHTEEVLKKLNMENDALADSSKKLTFEIEEIQPQLDELKTELKEKETELKQIIKTNEKEEAKLKAERVKLEALVKKPDYSSYMRIRKAKKGTAVATIKRSACSGCHNIVPAQRQLEIRKNIKMFFCEYCGRILISAEVAELPDK
jgi:hypothetical protein